VKSANLFTFITEYKGSTLVEQFSASDITEAVELWIQKSQAGAELDKSYKSAADFSTSISGLSNCWCITGLDSAETLILAHCVLTKGDT
jgi:hypothetical protein